MTAAAPSISSTRPRLGTFPSSSSSPASALMPTTVPMVSKKSDRISVKISRTTVTTPTPDAPNAPNRLKWPSSPKSGVSTILSGHAGVVSPQALTSAIELMIIARTVMVTMLIRIAPLTLRASSPIVSSTPRQNTRIGHPVSAPVPPS